MSALSRFLRVTGMTEMCRQFGHFALIRKQGIMESKIYGYVRVSSTDQNEDRQMMALNKVNVPEKNIYMGDRSDLTSDRNDQRFGKTSRAILTGIPSGS